MRQRINIREHFWRGNAPKILMVAPMSGHYATLLRGTVEAFVPTHQVHITDWADARVVRLRRAASISTTTSIT